MDLLQWKTFTMHWFPYSINCSLEIKSKSSLNQVTFHSSQLNPTIHSYSIFIFNESQWFTDYLLLSSPLHHCWQIGRFFCTSCYTLAVTVNSRRERFVRVSYRSITINHLNNNNIIIHNNLISVYITRNQRKNRRVNKIRRAMKKKNQKRRWIRRSYIISPMESMDRSTTL